MGDIRYLGQFESYSGIKYQVSIYDDEYTGEPETFKFNDDGFQLTYEGNTNDPWQPYIPSRLEFTFNVETQDDEDFIIECATSGPNRFKIFVTHSTPAGDYTNALFWQGYLQGEGIEIYDQAFPYEVRLASSDLSYLSEIPYNDGTTTTGVDTGVQHLLDALDYAGHAAFASAHGFDAILRTVVEWRGVSMEAGGDPLDKVGIDYRTFFDYVDNLPANFKSCREVIESISKLFGARFFQSMGLFRFQQYDGLIETTNDYQDYEADKTEAGGGSTGIEYELDRVDNFRMRGGSTSFNPGVKSADREYEYRRNYLEGFNCDQDNPLSVWLSDIPLLNYLVSSQAPKFTVKFNIVYKIVDVPDLGVSYPPGVGGRGWKWFGIDGIYYFKPIWRLKFTGTGGTDGFGWTYSEAVTERPSVGIEDYYSISAYKNLLKSKGDWFSYTYVKPNWGRHDALIEDLRYFEIMEDEKVSIVDADLDSGDYVPEERTISVELTIPYFGANVSPQDMLDVRFELSLHDMYSRHWPEWTRQEGNIVLADFVEWKVESFELIVHGDNLEENPETKRKYKVENPDDFRKKLSLDANILTALDKRTWHSVQVWNGTKWQDDQLWYRGTDSGNFKNLGYLSAKEQVALNRRGLRLYQGSLVTRGITVPQFHNIIVDNGRRFCMIAGTFLAKRDEWTSVSMIELHRDEDDLTYTEVKTEGAGSSSSGSSLPGGNTIGTGGPAEYIAPFYEYATAVTSTAYTITGIDMSSAAAFDNDELNKRLWIFQDSTKLIAGIGYTLSGQDLIFTDELEGSILEIYYYG